MVFTSRAISSPIALFFFFIFCFSYLPSSWQELQQQQSTTPNSGVGSSTSPSKDDIHGNMMYDGPAINGSPLFPPPPFLPPPIFTLPPSGANSNDASVSGPPQAGENSGCSWVMSMGGKPAGYSCTYQNGYITENGVTRKATPEEQAQMEMQSQQMMSQMNRFFQHLFRSSAGGGDGPFGVGVGSFSMGSPFQPLPPSPPPDDGSAVVTAFGGPPVGGGPLLPEPEGAEVTGQPLDLSTPATPLTTSGGSQSKS